MNKLGRAAVAVTVVFWSIGNLIVRDSPLSGPQIAFWRYLVAAIIYVVAHFAVVGPLRFDEMKRAAPTGIAIAVQIVVFFGAIKNTTVANATVIGALLPIILFVVATRRFSERIPLSVIVATLLSLGAVVAVVFGAAGATEVRATGDLLAVLALLLFAVYFVCAKVARDTLSTFALQTHSLIIGVPILLVVTVIDSGGLVAPVDREWLHVFGLVLFPSTGHLLINWAHGHVSLTLTSLMTLGVPVLSILGARIFFDETLRAVQVGGIALVLAVLSWAIIQTNRIQPEAALET